MDTKDKKLLLDALILILSVTFAVWTINSGFIDKVFETLLPVQFLAEFFAGMLFTSFLTTPLSLAFIYVLSENTNPMVIALVGALGAAAGDFFIVKLFRDSIFQDFSTLSRDLKLKRFLHFFRHSHFNHLAPLMGMLVIASPFPDEIGLMLLSASKLQYSQLFLLTYLLNALGIFLFASSFNLLIWKM
ncbi:MAG: hypothetical protein ACD_30C00112G0007 [uncultured bacterium]|uniref:TVP38/TMEM64 family membrane protein n=4 Tax=Microgenomates group TaxID=1794810 RepID=A0A1F5K594_9BACT|nr:MAG: hypothetical protein ACD_30C00112G0007 [uncultured bacterium]KKQ14751.1 MAG: hypothetical protein US28_C0030G0004 [Candidatus Daviesbacteria bacterium GW2011_GWA1_36_8]KKQ74902.1 MAG: hypothetical protein US96_C0022G0008 [Candidatus Woesebacteria bacterium GW2011_GWB1_38_5b]OGE17167.1 MAG: hypothetical protein A2858_00490 [Candidatus Daviesbacteria bacterium RIFCSPHIGHO2_01_FULL_36_37]OGE35948.1 MAG: hypothetical protein A3E66_01485 [Candidatus Daviesbacteria bacterium RIFCSPHIGHO2_12_F